MLISTVPTAITWRCCARRSSPTHWGQDNQVGQRIMASGATAQEKRQAIRRFFSEAHKVTTDKQGRILVPETHAAAADLKAEVVIVGAGRRFEIWSKERHESDVSANTGIYQRVAVEIGL